MRCDPAEVSLSRLVGDSAKECTPRQSQEIHFLVDYRQNEIALTKYDVQFFDLESFCADQKLLQTPAIQKRLLATIFNSMQ